MLLHQPDLTIQAPVTNSYFQTCGNGLVESAYFEDLNNSFDLKGIKKVKKVGRIVKMHNGDFVEYTMFSKCHRLVDHPSYSGTELECF